MLPSWICIGGRRVIQRECSLARKKGLQAVRWHKTPGGGFVFLPVSTSLPARHEYHNRPKTGLSRHRMFWNTPNWLSRLRGELRTRFAAMARRMHRSRIFNPHIRYLEHRIQSPQIRELVRKAAEIEPLITRPYGQRKASHPPRVHDCWRLFRMARKLQRTVGEEPVETIVLLPHLRHLSGTSRTAAVLGEALAKLYPEERHLLVTTDRQGEISWPDLPRSVEIFDFTTIASPRANPNFRERLLLDLISGTRAKRVITLNSKLGWDVYTHFGKGLATFCRLYAYLFCWDIDEHGDKVGYPITYLQGSFSTLSGVFFDSQTLRDEISRRYSLPRSAQHRLHVLHTPPENDLENFGKFGDAFCQRRRQKRPLRGLWAGRLDRQKRPDVAIEVMRRLPECQLDMYGAPVFGGIELDRKTLPENVRIRRPYRRFSDLPIDQYDFLLHTAEWEGLPNVIVNAAACGMPIVASAVGGIPELIDETTGWPVREHLDPVAYANRIQELHSTSPDKVLEKGLKLHDRVRTQHSVEHYLTNLKNALESKGASPP